MLSIGPLCWSGTEVLHKRDERRLNGDWDATNEGLFSISPTCSLYSFLYIHSLLHFRSLRSLLASQSNLILLFRRVATFFPNCSKT